MSVAAHGRSGCSARYWAVAVFGNHDQKLRAPGSLWTDGCPAARRISVRNQLPVPPSVAPVRQGCPCPPPPGLVCTKHSALLTDTAAVQGQPTSARTDPARLVSLKANCGK
jgi:hypothetical protein